MNKTMKLLCAGALLAILPGVASAQPSAHYVPGVEGIKGSSLPPPGVYARDYNVFYFADRVNDPNGDEIMGPDPRAFIYANVPRVIWITNQKLLGGFLGVDALIPLQYTSVELNDGEGGRPKFSTFGVGDLFAEATLSWHVDQADFSVGGGAWMPTGESSTTDLSKPGLGYWSPMFTAGMTWYMDNEKKWALSALNRYEVNTEKKDTDWTPGNVWTLEAGLSYALSKTVDLGIVGYYQQQVNSDDGTPPPYIQPAKDKVLGVGPEITWVCPKTGILFSLRYNYEVMSEARLQGHTVAFTLTKRL